MRSIAQIFLVLPALVIIQQLSDAIPVSEWLRALAVHWREFSHVAIVYVIAHTPFLPRVNLPPIILDEYALAALLATSTLVGMGLAQLINRSVAASAAQTQVSSRVFWISVTILSACFFLTYDYAFYEAQLSPPGAPASVGRTQVILITSALIWVMLVLLLLDERPDQPSRRWAIAGFVVLLGASHLSNVSSAIGASPVLWAFCLFAVMTLAATMALLHRYNRNAVPIVLCVTAGLLLADWLIRTGQGLWLKVGSGQS